MRSECKDSPPNGCARASSSLVDSIILLGLSCQECGVACASAFVRRWFASAVVGSGSGQGYLTLLDLCIAAHLVRAHVFDIGPLTLCQHRHPDCPSAVRLFCVCTSVRAASGMELVQRGTTADQRD